MLTVGGLFVQVLRVLHSVRRELDFPPLLAALQRRPVRGVVLHQRRRIAPGVFTQLQERKLRKTA